MSEAKPKQNSIIMYAHPACPMVGPVASVLKLARAPYDYINIYHDVQARETVRDINNGYESVPTLVFPDGSTLTEPSTAELRKKLESMGYKVPITALVTGNIWQIAMIAAITFAILKLIGVL